jgi:4-hydroxy-tetrahydrodipicolinate reductase
MLAEGRNQVLSEVARMSREGADCARVPGEIGIQTLRGGDIAGEHTAFFCGPGERIELTHRATSRDIFARGALQAAAWLNGKEPGLYSMFDVLALDNA